MMMFFEVHTIREITLVRVDPQMYELLMGLMTFHTVTHWGHEVCKASSFSNTANAGHPPKEISYFEALF